MTSRSAVMNASGCSEACRGHEPNQPTSKVLGIEDLDRRRLAESGHVRHDHPMRRGQLPHYRSPHDPAAFDTAM